jgi:mRNA interferase RelE/StbE
VEINQKAGKLLRKLDRPIQARLAATIAALGTDPRPTGVKALTGHPGLLRVRVDGYRVIYTVHDGELLVLVVHLGHRRHVHENL